MMYEWHPVDTLTYHLIDMMEIRTFPINAGIDKYLVTEGTQNGLCESQTPNFPQQERLQLAGQRKLQILQIHLSDRHYV